MAAINGSFAVTALLSAAAAARLFPHRPGLATAALAVPLLWLALAALAQLAVLERAATGRVAESDRLLERLRLPARRVGMALATAALALVALSL